MDRRQFTLGATASVAAGIHTPSHAVAQWLFRGLFWVARRIATRYPSRAVVNAAVGSTSRTVGRGALTKTTQGLAAVVGTDIAVGASRHVFNSAFDAAFKERYEEWFTGLYAPDLASGRALIPKNADIITLDGDKNLVSEYSTFGADYNIKTDDPRTYRDNFINVYLYDLDLSSAVYLESEIADSAALTNGSLSMNLLKGSKHKLGPGRKTLVNVVDEKIVGVSEPFVVS